MSARASVLVLPAAIYQTDVMRAAQKKGFWVITADNNPHNPGHRLADESHLIDLLDVAALIQLARDRKVVAVMSSCSDIGLLTAAKIAAALSLPGHPVQAIETLVHKDRFRTYMRSKGVLEPGCISIAPDQLAPKELPWPEAIVKPTDSSGSKGIRRIEQATDWTAAIQEAQKTSNSGNCVVEQFLSGPQCTCEGYMSEGRVLFSMVTLRKTASAPYVATSGHLFPSGLGPAVEDQVVKLCHSVLLDLGCVSGPFDADLVITDGHGPVILEISARLGGNSLTDFVRQIHGIDLAECVVDFYLGKPTAVTPQQKYAAAQSRILGSEISGTLEYPPGTIEAVRKLPGVLEVKIDHPSGSIVRAFHDGRARMGELLVAADSIEATDQILQTAIDRLQLSVRAPAA